MMGIRNRCHFSLNRGSYFLLPQLQLLILFIIRVLSLSLSAPSNSKLKSSYYSSSIICKEMNDNPGFVNTGMLSNTKSSISPSSSIECEMDKEDSWVVVKKQMTTVLIAPTSPPEQSQTRTTLPVPDTTELISTVVEKKRKEKHALANKNKNKDPLPYDSTLAGETKATVPRDLPLSMKSKPPMPLLPTGALSIANKRLRAHYLERKLQELGGLRNWLMSYKELQRFIDVLERKKVGAYQLANVISMSALKDMGFAPVGPRRKLICEIDRLCQPHCFFANHIASSPFDHKLLCKPGKFLNITKNQRKR